MFEAPEQWEFSCNFFLWECLGLCVLFLYLPAYEMALKIGLEFRNSEIYSKDYVEDFFLVFADKMNSYFFCKMNS